MKSLPKDSNKFLRFLVQWMYICSMHAIQSKIGQRPHSFSQWRARFERFLLNVWFNFKRDVDVQPWRESFLNKEQMSNPLHITPVKDVTDSHGHDRPCIEHQRCSIYELKPFSSCRCCAAMYAHLLTPASSCSKVWPLGPCISLGFARWLTALYGCKSGYGLPRSKSIMSVEQYVS